MHKPLNDTRIYLPVTLANGLRTLLVHDPHASRSAVALVANVGHFYDPDNQQGLAHLLEHMLFLGTEQFPEAGEYHRFIKTHGGSHNGWTGTEHSCYYFDIKHQFFAQALQRFAQFFYAPLLDPQWIDKERKAVDAEFRMKLRDDQRHLLQVHKDTCNPDHPFSKFSVGNLDTLVDLPGCSLHDSLSRLFERHYRGEAMTLAMVSSMPLSLMQEIVEAEFSQVRAGDFAPSAITTPLYLPEQLGIRLNVKPNRQMRKLRLSYALPDMQCHYRSKPLEYLSHLLGYEGRNSAFALLNDAGLISALHAGGGISGSNYRDFNIDVSLTETGYRHQDDVIALLYQSINQISESGIETWRYAEKQQILQLAFDHQEQGRPLDLAQHLALNMHYYTPDDYLYGDVRMDGLDEPLTRSILAKLHPENCREYLISPDVETNQISRWYEASYSVQPLPSHATATRDFSALQLPTANPYLPSRTEPLAVEISAPHPTRLIDEPHFRLWFKQEDLLVQPKGHLYISFDSPVVGSSTRHTTILRLVVELMLDHLISTSYQAELAGLSYNLYAHQSGLTLQLGGFSCKQRLLLEAILNQLYALEFSEARFQLVRERLLRNWRNAAQDRPVSQLMTELASLLQPTNPGPKRLVECLPELTLDDLKQFMQRFESSIHVEVLIHGDWLERDALDLGHWLEQRIFAHASCAEDCSRELLNINGYGTLTRQIEVEQSDSAIVIYYQSLLATPHTMALFSMLNQLLAPTFFHELRTRRQLGYLVGTGYLPMNRHPGLMLYVQSPNKGPAELLSCIDECLNGFHDELARLELEEWQQNQQGLIHQILEPDSSLRIKAQRFWSSIGHKDFSFKQRELIVAELEKLDPAQVKQFLANRMLIGNADRLILYSNGSGHNDYLEPNLSTAIDNVRDFKLTAERFVVR